MSPDSKELWAASRQENKEGRDFDVEDNSGNAYTVIATQAGYRLKCASIPSKFTLKIVFALVAVPDDYLPNVGNFKAMEFAGTKMLFDVLAPRPSPSVIKIDGDYKKNFKPFSIDRIVPVGDGN